MMKMVSSWSHYLDFQCNDCGETTHVDAARDFPTTVTCRSDKCRTSPHRSQRSSKADFVLIGITAGPQACWQPSRA